MYPYAVQTIGILSAMIVELEAHPYEPVLTRTSSAYNATQCIAAYAPQYPEELRELARKAVHSDAALERLRDTLLQLFPEYEALLHTTQAVDLIQGGMKVNALPERAAAIINHRISDDRCAMMTRSQGRGGYPELMLRSSVAEVQARIVSLLVPLTARFNVTLGAFGQRTAREGSPLGGASGHLELSVAHGYALDRSPITPTGPKDPYQLLAGTVRGAIEGRMAGGGLAVVVPQIEKGNTGPFPFRSAG